MAHPTLLLLDEPSFGLAPLVVKDIFNIMRRIRDEEKVSILLIEQNARIALELADTAYLLETGSIVKSGTSADMRQDDAVRRAYLGD
jgi:branched-chain amino acid transport system ATP-binding protein